METEYAAFKRVVLLGATQVGKTALISQIVGHSFLKEYTPTFRCGQYFDISRRIEFVDLPGISEEVISNAYTNKRSTLDHEVKKLKERRAFSTNRTESAKDIQQVIGEVLNTVAKDGQLKQYLRADKQDSKREQKTISDHDEHSYAVVRDQDLEGLDAVVIMYTSGGGHRSAALWAKVLLLMVARREHFYIDEHDKTSVLQRLSDRIFLVENRVGGTDPDLAPCVMERREELDRNVVQTLNDLSVEAFSNLHQFPELRESCAVFHTLLPPEAGWLTDRVTPHFLINCMTGDGIERFANQLCASLWGGTSKDKTLEALKTSAKNERKSAGGSAAKVPEGESKQNAVSGDTGQSSGVAVKRPAAPPPPDRNLCSPDSLETCTIM